MRDSLKMGIVENKKLALAFLAIILIVIFGVEALIMTVYTYAPSLSPTLVVLIDSLTLTLTVSPFLYFLMFRPLRTAYTEMEHRVQERTSELTEANKEYLRKVHELKESEEKYQSLFEQLSDAAFIVDARTLDITGANLRTQELTQYDREELLHKNIRDIFPDNVFEKYAETLLEPKEHETTLWVEGVAVMKDTVTIPVEISISSVLIEEENSLICLSRDITRRKEIEKQRIIYQKFSEASGQGFGIATLDNTITYMNPTLSKLLDIESPMTEYGSSFMEFYPEESRKRVREEVLPAILKQEQWVGELYILSKTGREVPTIENFFLIKDNEGNPLYIGAVIMDITERKKTEKELVLLARAIEQATDIIIITDPDGHIQYVNPAFEKVTGYSFTDVKGKNTNILKSDKQNEEFYREMWEILRKREVWKGALIDKKKNGDLFDCNTTITPIINSSGEVINFVGVSRDVSREVQLEKQFRQAQKMEALGTLAGGIAHDFNNILTGIIGFSELVQEGLKDGSRESGYINNVLKAGKRAKDLVQQILSFSRHGEQEYRALQLAPLIKETIKLLRATLPKRIELRTDIDNSPSFLLGDTTQLHQVIMNLCTNASQAIGSEQGTIFVRLKQFTADEDFLHKHPTLKSRKYLILTVSDTGCGMDESTMRRIFDPFFTTKDVGEGTGLGLAAVHGIAENHGGTVTVYSEVGFGSSFHVYLPQLEEEKEQSTASPIQQPIPTGSERILIVDDEEMVIEVTTRMLEGLGYHITGIDRPVEVLKLLTTSPEEFDLVITDQYMPKMLGIELARRIHKIKPTLPIILCTGFITHETTEVMHHSGIRKIIRKPTTQRELGEAVRSIIDGKQEE